MENNLAYPRATHQSALVSVEFHSISNCARHRKCIHTLIVVYDAYGKHLFWHPHPEENSYPSGLIV